MRNLADLSEFEDCWKTDMGAAVGYDPVMFRDRDLHGELGEASWMELFVFGITGRRFDERELQLLNAIWVLTSYPDPRIWNNRVAALAGTTRSTGSLALASALAVSEAEIYGGRPMIRAIETLQRAKKWLDRGKCLESFIRLQLEKPIKLAGFGRPNASGDERIKPMLALLEKLGIEHGPHVRIAFAIENFLIGEGRRFRMNYAGLVAAICADLGFSSYSFYCFTVPLFSGGFLPCYTDALKHPEGSFFPVRCATIQYQGPAPRSWGDPS